MRVCRRQDLLDLDVRDRRFGYPLELLQQGDPGRLAARGARRLLPAARRRHGLQGQRQPPGYDAHGPRLLEGADLGGGRRHEGAGGRQGTGARAREDPTRRRRRHADGRPSWPPPRSSTPSPPAGRPSPSATSRWTATSTTRSRADELRRSLHRLDRPPAARRRARSAPRSRPRGRRRPRPDGPGRHGHPAAHRRPTCGRSREAAADGDAVLGPATDGGWWVLALSDAVRRARPWPTYRCRGPTRSRAPATRWPRRARPSGSAHELTDVDTARRGGAGGRHAHRRALPPGLAVGDAMTTLPLASVYTHALQGHPCTVWEGDLAPQPLPTQAWLGGRRATADRALLGALPGADARHRLRPRTDDRGAGPGAATRSSGSTSCPRRSGRPARRGVPALLPQRLRPGAGRGQVGDRPARRRQHRHRRRPGRPAGARA